MIGLYLITHFNIGQELLRASLLTFKELPLTTKALAVGPNDDLQHLTTLAQQDIARLDVGDGVLILTDLYGATPSNLAHQLAQEDNVMVISGLNLPMLYKIYNYANLGRDAIISKAMQGGRQGVFSQSLMTEGVE